MTETTVITARSISNMPPTKANQSDMRSTQRVQFKGVPGVFFLWFYVTTRALPTLQYDVYFSYFLINPCALANNALPSLPLAVASATHSSYKLADAVRQFASSLAGIM